MSDDIGSLTEELRKLGIALGGLDGQHAHADGQQHAGGTPDGSSDAPSDDTADAPPDDASGAAGEVPAACRYCPVCQLIALARGQRTSSLDTLITAATGLVSALTSYVEQKAQQDPSAGHREGEDPGESRVERIDVE